MKHIKIFENYWDISKYDRDKYYVENIEAIHDIFCEFLDKEQMEFIIHTDKACEAFVLKFNKPESSTIKSIANFWKELDYCVDKLHSEFPEVKTILHDNIVRKSTFSYNNNIQKEGDYELVIYNLKYIK